MTLMVEDFSIQMFLQKGSLWWVYLATLRGFWLKCARALYVS